MEGVEQKFNQAEKKNYKNLLTQIELKNCVIWILWYKD